MTKVLEGKKGLIIGIANDHSIAWGIARSLHEEGASMYLTYQNDSIKKRVELGTPKKSMFFQNLFHFTSTLGPS